MRRQLPIPTLAALAALATALGAAQSPARNPILIAVHAADSTGVPVLDLKREDLALEVGGRARTLVSLELVRPASASGLSAILPAPFATNEGPAVPGRDLLLVVDGDSFMPGKEGPAREAIEQLVAAMAPADRVGLFSTRQGGQNIDLTTDRARVLSAAARGWGHSRATETEDDLVCRSAVGLQVLGAVFKGYAGAPPPTAVFLSAAFGAPPPGGRVTGNQGNCPLLRTTDFEAVGTAVRRANASFYVVHVLDATASQLPRERLATGLEMLSGISEASLVRIVGSATDAVQRIVRETSAYYLVGFEPEASDRTGKAQAVEVRSARESVRLRAGPEVTIPKPGPEPAGRPSPNDLLKVGTVHRDLALRAAAFPSRGDTSGRIRLVVVFETADPSARLTAAAVGLYDARGKLTSWTAEPADLARSPAIAGILVPAGTYRMRVAATDAASRSGTVDTEVLADLTTAGPVKLSGMMLGVSGSDGGFAPRLQFAGESGAFAYMEIYGAARGAAVSVVQEIAPAPDAPAIASETMPLVAGPADDVRIAYGGFDIGPLPPGDVVLRAIVSVNGAPAGRVVRTLRKTR